jgi:hypothetical protein
MFEGEPDTHNEVVKARNDFSQPRHMDDESKLTATISPSPVFNPQDLIGRSFLMYKQSDGQKPRATIVQLLEDHESSLEDNPTRIKFRVSLNKDQQKDIITYNKMMEYITKDKESDITWKFRQIISHEVGQGSQYDLLIEWENGEITKEPIKVIATDDPVTCAIYARENGLLNQPGWKRFGTSPKMRRSLPVWSIKLNLSLLILHLNIKMVTKFLGLMNTRTRPNR